jgi:hypothetical protein
MPLRRFRGLGLLLVAGWLGGCGVRGNPRPALPDVHPLLDAGTEVPSGAAPDAGLPRP